MIEEVLSLQDKFPPFRFFEKLEKICLKLTTVFVDYALIMSPKTKENLQTSAAIDVTDSWIDWH